MGKATDIHDIRTRMDELEMKASHDILTNLWNRTSAKEQILKQMEAAPDGNFALIIFDLDNFKSVNDTYGHIFGDCVLKHTSENLRQSVGENDIIARIGGDEFLIFLKYETDVEMTVESIFKALVETYDGVTVFISMGVAETSVVGNEYAALFHAADQALYSAKRAGRSQCVFYDDSMQGVFSNAVCAENISENVGGR